MADKAHLEAVMKAGADEAAYYARKTMSKVKRKIGFVN
jgi:tryptophanyl-tRNA synthetase